MTPVWGEQQWEGDGVTASIAVPLIMWMHVHGMYIVIKVHA